MIDNDTAMLMLLPHVLLARWAIDCCYLCCSRQNLDWNSGPRNENSDGVVPRLPKLLEATCDVCDQARALLRGRISSLVSILIGCQ